MKYFTKYIPVPGEIKEGDLYYEQIVGQVVIADKKLLSVIRQGIDKKVKLFLCSRDIQVGDKVIHLQNGEERIAISWEDYLNHKTPTVPFCTVEMAMDEKYHVKKIGEISPNAIWVKEGMKLKEYDTRVVIQGGLDGIREHHPDEPLIADTHYAIENYTKELMRSAIIEICNPKDKTFY